MKNCHLALMFKRLGGGILKLQITNMLMVPLDRFHEFFFWSLISLGNVIGVECRWHFRSNKNILSSVTIYMFFGSTRDRQDRILRICIKSKLTVRQYWVSASFTSKDFNDLNALTVSRHRTFYQSTRDHQDRILRICIKIKLRQYWVGFIYI
jgi:hypothetical protein